MTFAELVAVTGGEISAFHHERPVQYLVTDSRKAVRSESAVFFALRGDRHDGHRYISDLYQAGVRQFVTEHDIQLPPEHDANVVRVTSVLKALQSVASFHRSKFHIPVVGITGSNGKTIVKEWLAQALAPEFQVAKNPGSYNSQIGVALSVWMLQPHHTIGVFEAGLSRPGEMEKLETIIRPTLGIFTNLGPAHDEGFTNRAEKAKEKMKLFQHHQTVVYCRDHEEVHAAAVEAGVKGFTWGQDARATLHVIRESAHQLRLNFGGGSEVISLPFTDFPNQENALHVAAFLLLQEYTLEEVRERLMSLPPVSMRLELKDGINRCQVIDDTYNNDLAGLQLAIDFLRNQQKTSRTIILSDVLQTGLPEADWIRKVSDMLTSAGVVQWTAIGPAFQRHRAALSGASVFPTTQEFLASFRESDYHDQVILVKGARDFGFERIVKKLQRKVHGTVMEIDLDAMVNNLNYFRSKLSPGTKLMVMVKALAYGSGTEQIANWLQFHRVDYLGVAYADEGVELRKNNITIPVMVMNPSEESFTTILDYHLEPEVYSLRILHALIDFLKGRSCKVHLKVDTGMHRLGLEAADFDAALEQLKRHPEIEVVSIFSHLAGADDPSHDDFSSAQAAQFLQMAERLDHALGYKPMRHLLNSPGILRLPEFQLDMVRLGIGLYGVDPTTTNSEMLTPVSTLKTIISQIKHIRAGETVGYGRRGKATKDMTLATVAIGYADGYSRSFSQGKGKMLVGGKRAPVMGNVCMDMTMIDVTGIDAREGDEVIVFGAGLPIREVAGWIQTIPYELLAQTSERVKRVFRAESI